MAKDLGDFPEQSATLRIGAYQSETAPGDWDGDSHHALEALQEAHGICFGVLICAESGLIEPSLLLAEQGARLIFTPHYAFIPMASVEDHRQRVRNNHVARAVENDCWIVKANTVSSPMRKLGDEEGFGYGDSFILDNRGVSRAEAGLFSSGWIATDAPAARLKSRRESRIEVLPIAIREQVAKLYQPGV